MAGRLRHRERPARPPGGGDGRHLTQSSPAWRQPPRRPPGRGHRLAPEGARHSSPYRPWPVPRIRRLRRLRDRRRPVPGGSQQPRRYPPRREPPGSQGGHARAGRRHLVLPRPGGPVGVGRRIIRHGVHGRRDRHGGIQRPAVRQPRSTPTGRRTAATGRSTASTDPCRRTTRPGTPARRSRSAATAPTGSPWVTYNTGAYQGKC